MYFLIPDLQIFLFSGLDQLAKPLVSTRVLKYSCIVHVSFFTKQ